MFGRHRFFEIPKSRFCENKRVHVNVHVRRVAYFDEISRSTLYKTEYYTRKSTDAFTPQSGLATKELDLAYCFHTNTSIEHSPVLISAIDSRNPQSGQVYVQDLVKDFDAKFKDVSDNNNIK